MTLGTHVAFASVLYLSGATLFGYRPDWISWALAAVASLLPDIDLPPAKIGRLFWFISVPLERRFGHRTLTHSAVMLLAVATLAAPLWFVNPLYFWAVVGGIWSHLWLDMLNLRGIDLFWPSPLRVVTPGNRNWRLQVGSKGEMILLSALLVAAAALFPLSHLGFRDGLQALLKNFDIAREQYQRVAGTDWYALELTATDNLTLQPVTGKFPVVGVWQNGIVERDGALRAVGPSPAHHNLYPLKARLIQGEPLHVVAERVELRGHTLRGLLSRIDPNRPYFLLGEVEMPEGRGPAITGRLDSVDTYNPATYRGGVLRLHYARAPELEPWLDLVAVRGEVVVQFWLRPGEAAVTLGAGEEREVERIPAQLKRFL
ncbi:MAG: metal-dependent hydrolase [Candidatus Contendobacter sp.]|nr:MAG: metal-dependent hydrolase [Candidatus Contendobacter sp.]